MIYLKDGQTKLTKASEYVLATIKDNLESLVVLFDEIKKKTEEDEKAFNLQARLIAFACTTAEKLLLLNLYARNPLLLFKEDQLTRETLYKDFTYEHYDANWLYKQSASFVKPQAMWETLSTILIRENSTRLDDLETDFLYLKDIRNKYLHAFIIRVEPKSFYLIRDFIWVLLIRLFDALPEEVDVNTDDVLDDCGCNANVIKRIRELDEEEIITQVFEKFAPTLSELGRMQSDDEKRLHLLKKLVAEDVLNEQVPQYQGAEPVLETTPEDEKVQICKSRKDIILDLEIKVNCPVCSNERRTDSTDTGYLLVEVGDVCHREDSEGDFMIHEPPVDAEIEFAHYYCIGCGFYSDDYYLLEKLGYGEVLKTKVWFVWDINDGVGKPYEDDDSGVDILNL